MNDEINRIITALNEARYESGDRVVKFPYTRRQSVETALLIAELKDARCETVLGLNVVLLETISTEYVIEELARQGRRIVCAAMQYGALIVPSVRHWDHIARDIVQHLPESCPGTNNQGFVDNYGIFLCRKSAMKVALAAKQVKNPNPTEELFSEDLY